MSCQPSGRFAHARPGVQGSRHGVEPEGRPQQRRAMGLRRSFASSLCSCAMTNGFFFALFALSSLLVAFGKGSKLSQEVAAWSPYALFLLIGILLLWMRSTNRDIRIPKIFG